MTRIWLIRILLVVSAAPALFRGAHPHFVPPPASGVEQQAIFTKELLPETHTNFVHGASIAELANGDLLAAWYGGSDETRPDVAIFTSRMEHATGRWSAPIVVADRGSRLLKSVGNPVLFADANGVTLFYVVVIAGGWSGSTTLVKSSPDGVRWSDARQVIASPLFGAGVLVRGAPAGYDDGTIALPVYYQLGAKWSAIARVDRDGHVLELDRIVDRRPLIQPSLALTSRDDATMLFRYSSRSPLSVTMAFTNDAGLHWSGVAGTPLVHRDSGVAAVRAANGLLAFYNNTAWDRRDLSMAWTPDNGRHWSMPKPIERDTTPDWKIRREYSYPYAIRTRDGRTHLVYTWQRTRVAHVVFNDAWLRADPILGQVRR